ncbi:PQQ-binding-like beta-propeller repeat protein [Salinigranum marinum]|uniref:outer membrane protein assembly factor BamB family protein n=1 Tax=Salinigranum marinum TaxID=1515595 RepID=UPI002989A268|nr:PQQ-binding-like beta-propeller repeat protein [Salinigranum marinum]
MTWRVPRRRLLAGALGLAALAGCGYRPGGGDVRWTTSDATGAFGDGEAVYGPSGGVLAVSRSVRRYDVERETWLDGGVVTAYDPMDGERRAATTTEVIRRDCAGESSAYLGTETALVAVGADGTERWRTALDASPVAVDSDGHRVVALADDGRLAAFDTDGTRRWTTPVVESDRAPAAASDDTDTEGSSPAVARDAVLAVSSGVAVVQLGHSRPRVVAVAADGTVRWTRRDAGFGPVRRIPPVVTDGRLLAASERGLVSVSLEDGVDQWSVPVASPSGLAVAGDRCYLLERSGLSAVSLDGRERWTFGLPDGGDVGRRFSAGPVATSAGVFVATDRRLFGVAPDGTERWRPPIDTRPRGLALAPGVVVRTGDRELVAHWRRDQF